MLLNKHKSLKGYGFKQLLFCYYEILKLCQQRGIAAMIYERLWKESETTKNDRHSFYHWALWNISNINSLSLKFSHYLFQNQKKFISDFRRVFSKMFFAGIKKHLKERGGSCHSCPENSEEWSPSLKLAWVFNISTSNHVLLFKWVA